MSRKTTAKGFSLLEFIIAVILVGMVLTILFSLTVNGVKNGRFVQRLADVRTLASQKATQLFNDIPNQIKNIPVGQTQAGSLDPSTPTTGYFDLLNDSGCLINSSVVTVKGTPTQDSGGGHTTVDCSISNTTTPSNATVASYRRQWLIAKDKPSVGDVTVYVVVVFQDSNLIARSYSLIKVDGSTTK